MSMFCSFRFAAIGLLLASGASIAGDTSSINPSPLFKGEAAFTVNEEGVGGKEVDLKLNFLVDQSGIPVDLEISAASGDKNEYLEIIGTCEPTCYKGICIIQIGCPGTGSGGSGSTLSAPLAVEFKTSDENGIKMLDVKLFNINSKSLMAADSLLLPMSE